ncbi:MAG: DUF6495 family protein [Saprospiraceae bacterium]
MKYRRLSIRELESLEQEFIYFLVMQGIPADDWLKIKTEDTDKMNAIIDEFSDLVFQTSIEKAEFLLHIQPTELLFFHCKAEQMQLYALTIENTSDVDLITFNDFDQLLNALSNSEKAKRFELAKPYRPNRDQTIYQLLESGCGISDKINYEKVLRFFI